MIGEKQEPFAIYQYLSMPPATKKKAEKSHPEKRSVTLCTSIRVTIRNQRSFQSLNFCFDNKPGFLFHLKGEKKFLQKVLFETCLPKDLPDSNRHEQICSGRVIT